MAKIEAIHQMAKIANMGKGKGCKILGIEGFFTTMGGNPAEPSNLCRFVFKANDTTGATPLNMIANLPVSELPAIIELSKLALQDFSTSKKAKFSILPTVTKPKESDTNDEGTLIYSLGIEYDSSRNYPVTIVVKNTRGNVVKMPDGKIKFDVASSSSPQPYIQIVTTPREWLNKVENLNNMHQAWCSQMAAEDKFGF